MKQRRAVVSPRKVPAMHLDQREADEHVNFFGYANPMRESGELRLVEATYGDGLVIVMRLAREYKTKKVWRALPRAERRATLEACRWFLSDDPRGLYSFIGASHILDIDADSMRARVLRLLGRTADELALWVKAEAKQIRHEECA